MRKVMLPLTLVAGPLVAATSVVEIFGHPSQTALVAAIERGHRVPESDLLEFQELGLAVCLDLDSGRVLVDYPTWQHLNDRSRRILVAVYAAQRKSELGRPHLEVLDALSGRKLGSYDPEHGIVVS